MMMYIGIADPSANAKEVIAYYHRLQAANGGASATADFARLFLVPGMTHCRGGRSLDEFDPLQSLVDWVEQNRAPDKMVATGKAFPAAVVPSALTRRNRAILEPDPSKTRPISPVASLKETNRRTPPVWLHFLNGVKQS